MARKPKRDPRTVAIKDILGPMFEAMLQGEMDSHLGCESNDHGPKTAENRRNGYNSKTLKSAYGDILVVTNCTLFYPSKQRR